MNRLPTLQRRPFLKAHTSTPKRQTRVYQGVVDDEDFITSLVIKIFGRDRVLGDATPMGKLRLEMADPDKYPLMHPARKDIVAEPVEGDTGDITFIRPLLAKTDLEFIELTCAYDADVHGWTHQEFHACVDNQGPAVVVAKTEGGAVCGGYNPRGWDSLNDDKNEVSAFLFTWQDGDVSKPAIKLQHVQDGAASILDGTDIGIKFGLDGFCVPLNDSRNLQNAYCKLGLYYERLPDNSRSIFAPAEDRKAAQLKELKVYTAKDMKVEYKSDGYFWTSKLVKKDS